MAVLSVQLLAALQELCALTQLNPSPGSVSVGTADDDHGPVGVERATGADDDAVVRHVVQCGMGDVKARRLLRSQILDLHR